MAVVLWTKVSVGFFSNRQGTRDQGGAMTEESTLPRERCGGELTSACSTRWRSRGGRANRRRGGLGAWRVVGEYSVLSFSSESGVPSGTRTWTALYPPPTRRAAAAVANASRESTRSGIHDRGPSKTSRASGGSFQAPQRPVPFLHWPLLRRLYWKLTGTSRGPGGELQPQPPPTALCWLCDRTLSESRTTTWI